MCLVMLLPSLMMDATQAIHCYAEVLPQAWKGYAPIPALRLKAVQAYSIRACSVCDEDLSTLIAPMPARQTFCRSAAVICRLP